MLRFGLVAPGGARLVGLRPAGPFRPVLAPGTWGLRFSSGVSGGSPVARYQEKLRLGQLREDPRQLESMQLLEKLYLDLGRNKEAMVASRKALAQSMASGAEAQTAKSASGSGSDGSGLGGMFSSLFGGGSVTGSQARKSQSGGRTAAPIPRVAPKGLYLHGGVGCGKTFMMDLFYAAVKENLPELHCHRTHYHSFMLDIHRRLHQRRQLAKLENREEQDPLPKIASEIVTQSAQVLCLDEFQVTDIADAMVLRHLFQSLFERDLVLVATSNRAPEQLYYDGINRQSFLPFIDVLHQYCSVHLMAAGQDHRLLGTLNEGVFHSPHDSPDTKAKMAQVFERLAGEPGQPASVPVMMGRTLNIPKASGQSRGVAQFSFKQLCDSALSAADYIALAKNYANIIVTDIPAMSFGEREIIRRFITLLDVLYEHRCQLICSAAKPPATLFGDGEPKKPQGFQVEEAFASSRAVSRLIEMQSEEYIRHSGQNRRLE